MPKRRSTLLTWPLAIAVFSAVSHAQTPQIFADADLALGAELIVEHQCTACHMRRVGGDGASIYDPSGRINTPGFLRGMVEYCNTQLGLSLFPDEVTAISAVLNRDHYKFTE
ncbi:MAG: hypothetical protein R3E87_15560 [Burkholderiaceae bacterium]